MAILLNDISRRLATPPQPFSFGAVHVAEFVYDASAGLLAADIVDIGVLPAGCRFVDATFSADASLGAANVNVGILSGEIGDLNQGGRTLGTELFAAAAITNAHTSVVRMSNPAGFALAANKTTHRSIGLQVSANIAAGAGKVIRLFVEYRQVS